MAEAHLPSRRGFLRNLVFGSDPAVKNAGPHTLVVVFLRGGADTLNMIVPYADDFYYAKRPNLAIAHPDKGTAEAAIKIDDLFGFHPKMRPLVPLFREGRLGVVNAVGSDNPTGSHFEAQDQIEHGETFGQQIGGGWLGRYLRTRASGNSLSAVAIGETLPEALRGAPSASAIRSIDEIQIVPEAGREVVAALEQMYGAEVGVLADQGRQTLGLMRKVESLRGRRYAPGVEYPDDGFGAGLREIARLIKADLGLEAATIDLDGWDTHFFQGSTAGLLTGLVDTLSRGLAAFDADLAAHRDRVTTVVLTEFGRRLYENGSLGTDHGRGFSMLAMGPQINGGQFLGGRPGLAKEADFPLGPGGLDVRCDYRSVLSEILRGVMGCTDLANVFPSFAPESVGLVG